MVELAEMDALTLAASGGPALTPKEWADSILGVLRVLISWPVFAVVFVLVFRRQITALLLSIRKLSKEGIEIGPQTETSASRTTSVLAATSDPAVENMLRAFDSPVLREQEQRIRRDFESQHITGPAAFEVLIRHLAVFQIGYFFEWAYSQIWGSQLFILQTLNATSAPVPLQRVRPIYDAAAQQHPEAFASYPFENYINYLVTILLIARTNGNISITPLGREFLAYIARVGKPFIKPQ